jgi:hypothetical protein
MKLYLTIATLLLSLNAHASLKLVAQDNAYEGGTVHRQQVGLAWYKPLFKKDYVALNSYLGYGSVPLDEEDGMDTNWTVVKTQIDFHIKKLTMSPGYQYRYASRDESSQQYLFLRAEYKLD